jgi:hypothetical protein
MVIHHCSKGYETKCCPDITVVEILLKVVLNTLALTHLVDSNFICYQYNGILPDSEEKT